MTREPLVRGDAVRTILDLLEKAHAREPFVGGLFHAYEKALHFVLLTELYRAGVWGTETECVYERDRGAKCDLVVPLDSGRRLWLEAKIVWFSQGKPFTYWTLDRYLTTPVDDWRRLEEAVARHDDRAVLVLLVWDGAEGRLVATDWVKQRERDLGHAERRELRHFDYEDDRTSQRLSGMLLLWSSLPRSA